MNHNFFIKRIRETTQKNKMSLDLTDLRGLVENLEGPNEVYRVENVENALLGLFMNGRASPPTLYNTREPKVEWRVDGVVLWLECDFFETESGQRDYARQLAEVCNEFIELFDKAIAENSGKRVAMMPPKLDVAKSTKLKILKVYVTISWGLF